MKCFLKHTLRLSLLVCPLKSKSALPQKLLKIVAVVRIESLNEFLFTYCALAIRTFIENRCPQQTQRIARDSLNYFLYLHDHFIPRTWSVLFGLEHPLRRARRKNRSISID